MNLPGIILTLLIAQSNFDSQSYANCFSETAIVHDEGETHRGRNEIKQWSEKTNAKYKTRLEAIDFSTNGQTGIMTTRVSGTFDGSPVVLKFQFEIENGFIQSLKITG